MSVVNCYPKFLLQMSQHHRRQNGKRDGGEGLQNKGEGKEGGKGMRGYNEDK